MKRSKNFFAELSRQYSAMRDLFAGAGSRLGLLLDHFERLEVVSGGQETPELERLGKEIQDLLYHLGAEALDEHAEWLILHRARPLQPFAGS